MKKLTAIYLGAQIMSPRSHCLSILKAASSPYWLNSQVLFCGLIVSRSYRPTPSLDLPSPRKTSLYLTRHQLLWTGHCEMSYLGRTESCPPQIHGPQIYMCRRENVVSQRRASLLSTKWETGTFQPKNEQPFEPMF